MDPVRLLDQVLAEFDEVSRAETESLLNLTEAARECGYSPDALGRMIRSGRIPNRGRPGAPRVRRADLPRKTGRPPLVQEQIPGTRTRIARIALDAQTNGGSRLA
ncbi:MAG: helix-turn-helix domain-containing protein [Gemmatimonadales bacterium]